MKPLSLATFPAYIIAEIPIGMDRAKRVIRRLLWRSGGTTTSRMPVPERAYFSVLDGAKVIPAIFDPALIRQVRTQTGTEQNSRDSVTTFYVLCTIELLLREAPGLRQRLVFD